MSETVYDFFLKLPNHPIAWDLELIFYISLCSLSAQWPIELDSCSGFDRSVVQFIKDFAELKPCGWDRQERFLNQTWGLN